MRPARLIAHEEPGWLVGAVARPTFVGRRRSTPRRQDQGRGQGLERDKAQVSLCESHGVSVLKAAAAGQATGPSVAACQTSQEAREKQGQVQRRQVRVEKGNSRRPATQSRGELPGAESLRCGGQRLGTSSRVALEPRQKSAQEQGGRLDRDVADRQMRGQIPQGQGSGDAKGRHGKTNE